MSAQYSVQYSLSFSSIFGLYQLLEGNTWFTLSFDTLLHKNIDYGRVKELINNK